MRYEITFTVMGNKPSHSYQVATLHGVEKAIVIATQKHSNNSSDHILSVITNILPGKKPEVSDLIDRMEW